MPQPLHANYRLFSLLVVLALAGCAGSRTDDADGGATDADLDSAQDFAFWLGRQGYVLHPAVLAVPPALGVSGNVYEIQTGGGYLILYEFPDEATARRGADAIQLDALGGARTALFQRGPLVVLSSGGRSGLILTLTNALGPALY
jgi:hypothetical protein